LETTEVVVVPVVLVKASTVVGVVVVVVVRMIDPNTATVSTSRRLDRDAVLVD
jgi:hypothetical protein